MAPGWRVPRRVVTRTPCDSRRGVARGAESASAVVTDALRHDAEGEHVVPGPAGTHGGDGQTVEGTGPAQRVGTGENQAARPPCGGATHAGHGRPPAVEPVTPRCLEVPDCPVGDAEASLPAFTPLTQNGDADTARESSPERKQP